MNPFITGGYAGPEYFCNRTDEITRLSDAVVSRRNVTLISLRRMGKNGFAEAPEAPDRGQGKTVCSSLY